MGTMDFDGLDGLGAAEEVVPRLVQKAKAADEKVVAFVRERPVVALVAALAAGYVVGRLISRFG
jgi:ElaB/YqjD/DUF883 family membrane-anchored ribosome-binding protein